MWVKFERIETRTDIYGNTCRIEHRVEAIGSPRELTTFFNALSDRVSLPGTTADDSSSYLDVTPRNWKPPYLLSWRHELGYGDPYE